MTEPRKLGHNAPLNPVALPPSSTASMRQSLARGSRAAEVILRAYPQADARVTEAFAAELTQFISTLTEQELGWVMDTRNGIKAKCKFLPTPADINELIAERRAASEFIRPGTSGYRKLGPDDDIVQPPGDRRKAQVRELLGYDPAAPTKRTIREELVPPTPDDMVALAATMKIKPPERGSDASPQLKALLLQPEEERLT